MSAIQHPFPPLYDAQSEILILGSFPSVKSREQQFFYAHPQNRFWRVTAALFGAEVPVSIEEKRAYLDSLSEEERAEFLVHLTPEERSSLIRQLEPEQKKEIAGGLVELGQEMGMNLSVEDVDSLRFQVRDKNGRLIDSATLGTTVDPTGWNTTVPVLGGSAMILLALGGFAVMLRRTGRQEDQSNG